MLNINNQETRSSIHSKKNTILNIVGLEIKSIN